MCVGIIRNNSSVGGRARAESNPGHSARHALLHMAAECINHSAMEAGRCQVMWPIKNFGGSNHITGTAEPKVVKICTQVAYINFSNRVTYHPQKGRGYGHVCVLKFCR